VPRARRNPRSSPIAQPGSDCGSSFRAAKERNDPTRAEAPPLADPRRRTPRRCRRRRERASRRARAVARNARCDRLRRRGQCARERPRTRRPDRLHELPPRAAAPGTGVGHPAAGVSGSAHLADPRRRELDGARRRPRPLGERDRSGFGARRAPHDVTVERRRGRDRHLLPASSPRRSGTISRAVGGRCFSSRAISSSAGSRFPELSWRSSEPARTRTSAGSPRAPGFSCWRPRSPRTAGTRGAIRFRAWSASGSPRSEPSTTSSVARRSPREPSCARFPSPWSSSRGPSPSRRRHRSFGRIGSRIDPSGRGVSCIRATRPHASSAERSSRMRWWPPRIRGIFISGAETPACSCRAISRRRIWRNAGSRGSDPGT